MYFAEGLKPYVLGEYTMQRIMKLTIVLLCCYFVLPIWAGEAVKQEIPKEQNDVIDSVYPGLAAGVLSYAQLAELPEDVLLQSDNLKFSLEDLKQVIAQSPKALQKQLTKNAFFVMEQEITPKLILREAKAALASKDAKLDQKTEQEIIQTYVDQLTEKITVTDADIERFYQENESIFCGTPLEKVKDRIGPFVLREKKQQFTTEHLRTLGKKIQIQVSVDWVKDQARLAKDNPLDKARDNGKVTLAVFSAASCCGPDKMKPVLATLGEKYDTKTMNTIYLEAKQEQILAARYQVRSIPTQIFFDKIGREVYRHVGFFSVEDIEKQLSQIGIQ